jgi:hypothetical protein
MMTSVNLYSVNLSRISQQICGECLTTAPSGFPVQVVQRKWRSVRLGNPSALCWLYRPTFLWQRSVHTTTIVSANLRCTYILLQRYMGEWRYVYGRVEIWLHTLLTSALSRGEWSASGPGRFNTGERISQAAIEQESTDASFEFGSRADAIRYPMGVADHSPPSSAEEPYFVFTLKFLLRHLCMRVQQWKGSL